MRALPLLALVGLFVSLLARSSRAEPEPPGHPDERAGRFEAGFRVGGGTPYLVHDQVPSTSHNLSFVVGGRFGVRATPALSLSLDIAMLFTPVTAATTLVTTSETQTKAEIPGALVLLSPTLGLHPFRVLELVVGPSLGAGASIVAGGTARLAVHVPVGAGGVRLVPAVETFLVGGANVALGTALVGFGVEL